MVTITRTKDEIRLEGHANYAPEGLDIVCAGVSALVQTLIQSVQELTEDKIEYDMSPGRVYIKFWCLSEQAQVLLNAFFIGVGQIAEAYPDNVHVQALTT